MTDIERRAAFYLGKVFDLQSAQVLADQTVMYDARDLTTHAVCIGMTGSGKTGLGVTLLEEAALDGIPSIVIDPKGDMTNLLLTFPELQPADFQPWVNVDDASRKGQTVEEYAAAIAQSWAKGLASWGQDAQRIRRLKEAAEFVIYTPGSDAGVPVNVLQSFAAPTLSWDDEEETLRETISGTVSGLLGLVGIQADPVQSREHIFLSTIFEHYWRRGESLDLAKIIGAIQRPPVAKMGVFDVETFYPEKERFALAMALNRVVASPTFGNWLTGTPLDVASLIQTAAGKPRVCVFYIAHLSDAERMFFVTLLLEQVLTWMRRLSGTTSLRALLYFDEMFGYLPPHPANPPCKRPLLALLKQARAFGLGLILTTQNPVDLDYKGLTNAGTWFIGKLQTDRDKARVLEGMEGVVAEANTMLDRAYLDRLISSLGSRVFVLHNVHADRPILYQTRWAMSYLRGPLTRSQVRLLMAPLKGATVPAQPAPQPSPTGVVAAAPGRAAVTTAPPVSLADLPEGYALAAPRIDARIAQYYLPLGVSQQQAMRVSPTTARRGGLARSAVLAYEPHLVASATLTFAETQTARSRQEELCYVVPLPGPHDIVRWDEYAVAPIDPRDLLRDPEPDAAYGRIPDGMGETPPYTRFRSDLVDYIYRERSLPQWAHARLKLRSQLAETREAFAARVGAEAKVQRDAEIAKARDRAKVARLRLEDRLKRAEDALEDQEIALRGRREEEGLAGLSTVLGALLGGGGASSKIRRIGSGVSSASRRRRMTSQTKANLQQAQDEVADLKRQLAEFDKQEEEAIAQINASWEGIEGQIEEIVLRPRKTDIRVGVFGVLWVPQWAVTWEDERGALSSNMVPAANPAAPVAG